MPIIDRYILSEWLKIFAICLALTVGLIVLQDMYNNLPDLLLFGASFKDILGYYWLTIPSFLPLIVPLAFLASLIYSLGILHRNHEITAMRTAGLSVFKITRSLWIASVILALTLFYLNGFLVPDSIEKSQAFYDNLYFNYHNPKSSVRPDKNVTFYNAIDNRLWFLGSLNRYTHIAYDVNIYFRNEKAEEVKRLWAKSCIYNEGENKWIFKQGTQMFFENGEPIRCVPFDEISMENTRENLKLIEVYQKKIRTLSYRQINLLLDYFSCEAQSPNVLVYKSLKHKLLASPFSCIVILALSIPFTISGVRTNPFIGLSKTVAFLFLYYFFAMIFSKMGESGVINPIVAAWAPMSIALGASLKLYRSL